MDEYYARRAHRLLVWRKFARSAGIVTAAAVLLATLDPSAALIGGLASWFTFYLFRRIIPDIVDRKLWSCCSVVVVPTTVWLIRWPLVAIALVVSVARGASFVNSALLTGGFLVYDIAVTFLFEERANRAPKITRWSLLDGFRLARTIGRNLTDPTQYTVEEFIAAAEAAVEQHPNEWVVFYTLGDKYQEVGRYVDALRVCKRCVELRPKDVRSVYALATAYNLLTRATWSEKEMEAANILEEIVGTTDTLDPALAQAGLDQAGLVVETAAAQAMRWFERALMLNPDRQSEEQIEWDLRTLYKRFSHLQQ